MAERTLAALSATPTRTEVMPHTRAAKPDGTGIDRTAPDNATPPPSPSSGAGADRDEKRMDFVKALAIVDRGFQAWAIKPHNRRWFKRIDGTPIPNDICVNIAEAFVAALLETE